MFWCCPPGCLLHTTPHIHWHTHLVRTTTTSQLVCLSVCLSHVCLTVCLSLLSSLGPLIDQPQSQSVTAAAKLSAATATLDTTSSTSSTLCSESLPRSPLPATSAASISCICAPFFVRRFRSASFEIVFRLCAQATSAMLSCLLLFVWAVAADICVCCCNRIFKYANSCNFFQIFIRFVVHIVVSSFRHAFSSGFCVCCCCY